eukprot:767211-Hanusia_phi.AAC.2
MTSKHEILQGMIQRLKGDRAPRAPSDLLDVDEFESKPAAQNQDNTFNKGDRVHIFGLRNAKQYNGQVGSIVTNEEDSKWLVRLDDGTEIIAKEKNLSLPVFNVNEAPRVRHTSHEREGAKTHAHLGPSSRFLNQREEGGNTPKDEVRSSRTPGCSNFDASTGKNVPCSFREQEREGNDDVNLFLKRDALPEEVKSKFPVASKAVVVGLKTATEINGRTASIIGYADDRIIVKVETISEFGSGTGSKIFKVGPAGVHSSLTPSPSQIRPKHLQALSEFFCDGQEDQTSRPRRTRSSDRRFMLICSCFCSSTPSPAPAPAPALPSPDLTFLQVLGGELLRGATKRLLVQPPPPPIVPREAEVPVQLRGRREDSREMPPRRHGEQQRAAAADRGKGALLQMLHLPSLFLQTSRMMQQEEGYSWLPAG